MITKHQIIVATLFMVSAALFVAAALAGEEASSEEPQLQEPFYVEPSYQVIYATSSLDSILLMLALIAFILALAGADYETQQYLKQYRPILMLKNFIKKTLHLPEKEVKDQLKEIGWSEEVVETHVKKIRNS